MQRDKVAQEKHVRSHGPTYKKREERGRGEACRIERRWAWQARGTMLARKERDFFTYTTTGHGGDRVGFFYQEGFSLYTRALGTEVWGCVSFD